MTEPPTVLVVAKVPVPGHVKTRLCPPLSPAGAADVAAASLLDSLRSAMSAARSLGSQPPVVALSGHLGAGRRKNEVLAALRGCRVIGQRGAGLADRLASAHLDCRRLHPGAGTVQIGMDTPQVHPDLLVHAADCLESADAALGLAADGGWWALALREPHHAQVLRGIPTSRSDTGMRTREALAAVGLTIAALPVLRDVDRWTDAIAGRRAGACVALRDGSTCGEPAGRGAGGMSALAAYESGLRGEARCYLSGTSGRAVPVPTRALAAQRRRDR